VIALIVLATLLVCGALGAVASRPAPRRGDRRPSSHATDRTSVPTALVDLVERTSRDVRSGVSLRTALVEASAHSPHVLPGLHDRLSRGVPLQHALDEIGATESSDARFVVHGLRLAADTGGALADTLDRVVAVVRERQAWRAERFAQAAQARLSARMLTVLPMAVALWGLASGPRVRQAYALPATAVLTCIGVALNLVGWWWMRRLVRGRQGS
jgi:tight adherence protein B